MGGLDRSSTILAHLFVVLMAHIYSFHIRLTRHSGEFDWIIPIYDPAYVS